MTQTTPLHELLDQDPYGLDQGLKTQLILPRLDQLTRDHYRACTTYRNIVDRAYGGLPEQSYNDVSKIPFIPVSLFKTHELRSVAENRVFKVLTSSGTTGSAVSKVLLDRENAADQSRVLVKLLQYFLGRDRLPMIIIDAPNVVKDRYSFSARGAGILGMMQFGHRPIYALREDMTLNEELLLPYLEKNAGKRFLFFGFTFMVWQHFIQTLKFTRC